MQYLRELLVELHVADVLDILVISVFLYVLLTWLRRSAPRRLAAAAVVLVGLYVLAEFLGMYLTTWLVEGVAIVLLLTAAIVFQPDLRRIVDRLGAWSRRRTVRGSEVNQFIDELSQAIGHLAEHRVGALVALRGWRDWTGEIVGGVALDGRVSEPLLHSIFSPDSPGHDGAVLLEDDRVVRFAAHLPLSDRPEIVGWGGTRHAAAVGLAERSDALVVVVSEERGTISVAEHGDLVQVPDVAELKRRLEQFCQHHDTGQWKRSWRWTWANLGLAVLALVLATSISLAVREAQSGQVQRTFVVPIELRNPPRGWQIDGPIPANARVMLTGSEQAFQLLSPEDLMISLDLSHPKQGENVFVLRRSHLNLTRGLELQDVQPAVIHVYARQLSASSTTQESAATTAPSPVPQ